MEIKSQYNINNLLRHKFETENDMLNVVYEVMEVKTQTCYAGTQVFYECRPIHIAKGFRKDDKWSIAPGFSTSKTPRANDWVCFREDELVEAPPHIVDMVIGK